MKGANKDTKIYVGRSATVYNLLFCSYTLWINYVINALLLVRSSVRSKQLLCFVMVRELSGRVPLQCCFCSDELHFFRIGENCKDTHNMCNQWAADNLCDKGNDTIDSQSVQRVCPKSCKVCF